jgi:hypothetical protein
VIGYSADRDLFERMGLQAEVLDAGCCGLAGSFGYERDHYQVSMKAGEHALLPAVRRALPDTLIVADGFSCRSQIAHATDRRALHLAEVALMAMREGSTAALQQPTAAASRGRAAAALAVGGVLAAGGAVWMGRNRRRRHARAG